jgi:hypothetical protein
LGVGLAGFLAGLSFAVFWRCEHMQASALLGYAFGVVVTTGFGVVITREIGAGRAIVLLALGAGAVVVSMAAIRRITEMDDPVGLESDWGGLGQGLGGWRLSASATLVLVALVFAGIAAGVATTAPSPPKSNEKNAPAQKNDSDIEKKPSSKEQKNDVEPVYIKA